MGNNYLSYELFPQNQGYIADRNSSNDKCMDGLNPIRHREPPLSL